MTVWVMNLDAEEELRVAPRPYQATKTMRARSHALARSVPELLGPGDVILDEETPAAALASGMPGDAWSPTPLALARLRAAQVQLPAAPSWQILRRVNDRAFAVALSNGPLDSRYLADLDAIVARLRASAAHEDFLLKRALGFAGRGQRRVRRELDATDRQWCVAALAQGLGITLEPLVPRQADFAQHGFIDQAGRLSLGNPTIQRCDARGRWQASKRAADNALGASEGGLLRASAELVAEALHNAGYFGPFGIDAFRYLDPRGRPAFNPLVELNARYTMGFGVSGCPRTRLS